MGTRRIVGGGVTLLRTERLLLEDELKSVPRVVAVVLNWCDAEATARAVSSLQSSGYPELSILLVDNGSPDGSGVQLQERFPEVDFLQTGSNLGYTGGNNRGIERALEAGADYLFVLNHDTQVEPGVIDSLVSVAETEERVGAVAPTVVCLDDPTHIWYGGGTFDPKRALGVHWNGKETHNGNGRSRPREVTFFSGCSVLLNAEAIRDVGAFAESYFLYVEDAELSVRLNRAGWRILHDPGARIRHRVPPDDAEPRPDQIRYRDRNRRRLAREHLSFGQRTLFTTWFYPTRAVHLGRYLLQGDLPRAQAVLQGLRER